LKRGPGLRSVCHSGRENPVFWQSNFELEFEEALLSFLRGFWNRILFGAFLNDLRNGYNLRNGYIQRTEHQAYLWQYSRLENQ
jgi:hypothetical protein